jgi:[CysO sulfur-carrier protein]-S-L-cysteine hydrolase
LKKDWEIMHAAVSEADPEEACGYLAGKIAGNKAYVQAVIPIENITHSQTSFRMNPHEQINALYWMDENQMEPLGFYHSHPDGPAFLSETDRKELHDPSLALVLWSKSMGKWSSNAYQFKNGAVGVVRIELQG